MSWYWYLLIYWALGIFFSCCVVMYENVDIDDQDTLINLGILTAAWGVALIVLPTMGSWWFAKRIRIGWDKYKAYRERTRPEREINQIRRSVQ